MKSVLLLFIINHLCFFIAAEFFTGTLSKPSDNSFLSVIGLIYAFVGFPLQLLIELLLLIGFCYQLFNVGKYQASAPLWLAFFASIMLMFNFFE
ncbi:MULTISPECIES: hypothetical protein [unclassified Pseudoalteromonas]|uniref:hypothetical protein n=1 Tax=Pseudoalteromonas TaxID=53246 RepID=UPI0015FF7DD6|nr:MULTISPECIES: hypothetical protein [unclassified Pseudoalteromonas]MBB1294200.1 hypothetical protein [Pseudoalteromonas sp. SR41-4]MBB1300219.1 hypothetical protein [Pseudoalteromonas sp. SR44-8]